MKTTNMSFRLLRAGASGYMLKEAADTELITALHVIKVDNSISRQQPNRSWWETICSAYAPAKKG